MVRFKPPFERRYPRTERIVAIVALINLGLVFFDFTYLNLRQVYKQYLPSIVQVYDPVKGVEANPETEYYQTQVDNLAAQLAQANSQPAQVESSLSELRVLSQRLMTENTFVAPNGEYALATIQHNIRARTGETFASDAFNVFWSSAYLEQQGWQQELQFWNTQVRPFLQANYYRRANQLGAAVDYFCT